MVSRWNADIVLQWLAGMVMLADRKIAGIAIPAANDTDRIVVRFVAVADVSITFGAVHAGNSPATNGCEPQLEMVFPLSFIR